MIYSAKNMSRFSCLFLALVLCSCAAFPTHSADPTYDGKTLTEWLLMDRLDQPPGVSADEALRLMGTNAIPLLLDLVGTTAWNKGRVATKFDNAVAKLRLPPLHGMKAEDFRSMGKYGLGVLGTNAEPAVPRLTKLLRNEETCMAAAAVLAGVGPKGFAVLTNAFSDRNLVGAVILALGSYGGADQKAATRLLITALKDPNPFIRGNAADFLGRKDVALAVPALIPVLDDTEYYPKARAALALGDFGPSARSAAPRLLALYTNVIAGRDRELARTLGSAYWDALRRIDQEAAGKAEAFLVNSGPLNAARFGYTRTLLKNKKELIAGGYVHTEIPTITNRDLSSAQIYDPVTGIWTETGKMNSARAGHKATLLPNGKVLVEGGYGPDGVGQPPALSSKELYDPATGTWTLIANR
jgi:hypothetical protein